MGNAPPLVGVAVKLTVVPVHTLVTSEAIITLGVTFWVTVSVIVLLVAVLVVWQVLLAVRVKLTTSPLFKPASV